MVAPVALGDREAQVAHKLYLDRKVGASSAGAVDSLWFLLEEIYHVAIHSHVLLVP